MVKDDVVVVVFSSIIGPNRRKTFCAPENDVEKTIIVVRIIELQARRRLHSATNARLFGRIDIERGTGEDATERARERASSSRKWEERGEDDDEEEEERDEKQSVDSGRGRCGREPRAADIWSAFGRRGTDGGA